MRLEQLPGLSQVDTAVTPVEERDTEVAFERLHLHGDGGLGDAERLGGFRERPVLDDGNECAQLRDVHVRSPRPVEWGVAAYVPCPEDKHALFFAELSPSTASQVIMVLT